MKAIFFLLALMTAFGCLAHDSVKIYGQIQAQLSDSIEISYNDNNLAYYPKQYFPHVDKKGRFSLVFPFKKGIYIQAEIKHGNKVAEVMLHSGDSLVMMVNAKKFDSTIHYSGRGSEIQNFIARHTLEKGRMNQYTVRIKTAINKDDDAFLKDIDNELKSEMSFLDKYKASLPASFVSYWQSFYKYYNYFFIEQFPQTHQMITLKRYTDTVPASNYSVISQLKYDFNDSLLQVPPYLLYLTGVFEAKLKAAGYTAYTADTLKMRRFEDSVYTLAYKELPDQSGAFFIAQNIYARAKRQPIARTREQFKKFESRRPKYENMAMLKKQIAIAERLAPGQPAPDFDIITPDDKHMKLSDLKGKVVYLGFWAGWCRQCVGEMMAEKKIKDLIRNKPLEFVYVSISADTAFEHMLTKKYKLNGTFTTAVNGWQSKEVEDYGVQMVPAYYLIDEDGNFAAQNAPTPQQTMELVMMIEKLFK